LSIKHWMSLALVVALAALLLLAVACKSDSKSGGDKTPAVGQTPTVGQTPASGQTPADGGGEQGLDDLKRLASQAAEEFTGSISYRTTTEAGGQTTEQDWIVIERPPSDHRFEIISNEGGQESRTIVIRTAEQSYICTSVGGSESCLATDQTDQYTGPFDPIFDVPKSIVQDIDTLGLADQSERDIAGVHANCFSYSLAGAESETCFSDEGLLLYLRGGSAGSSYTFEVTSATTDVSDADFEPPYEVIDLPTG